MKLIYIHNQFSSKMQHNG